MKLPFNTIFESTSEGYRVKSSVHIGALTLHEGVVIDRIYGLELSKYEDNDLDLETRDDVWVLKGIY